MRPSELITWKSAVNTAPLGTFSTTIGSSVLCPSFTVPRCASRRRTRNPPPIQRSSSAREATLSTRALNVAFFGAGAARSSATKSSNQSGSGSKWNEIDRLTL